MLYFIYGFIPNELCFLLFALFYQVQNGQEDKVKDER